MPLRDFNSYFYLHSIMSEYRVPLSLLCTQDSCPAVLSIPSIRFRTDRMVIMLMSHQTPYTYLFCMLILLMQGTTGPGTIGA